MPWRGTMTTVPLQQGRVDMAALVREYLTDTAVLEPDRPITVHAPDSFEITADSAGMGQILANLLANVRADTPVCTGASGSTAHPASAPPWPSC